MAGRAVEASRLGGPLVNGDRQPEESAREDRLKSDQASASEEPAVLVSNSGAAQRLECRVAERSAFPLKAAAVKAEWDERRAALLRPGAARYSVPLETELRFELPEAEQLLPGVGT